MALTNLLIQQSKPKDKPYKVYDAQGKIKWQQAKWKIIAQHFLLGMKIINTNQIKRNVKNDAPPTGAIEIDKLITNLTQNIP